MSKFSKDDLVHFPPRHAFFVGIDSDGCVFDTMEVKQKLFFHPLIIQTWNLQPVEKQVRAAAEFVNLYSKWRGSNRFPALLRTFDLLQEWSDVRETGVALPDTKALRAYIDSGVPLSNATLKQAVAASRDPALQRVLDWSLAVNVAIAARMDAVPPFRGVRECLEKLQPRADLIVVSQTPEEALVHEWELHGLESFVELIAGQELGTKAEHLALATDRKYPADRILMIGDAPGDRKAAQAVQARFYPILPGQEEASWKRLADEGIDRFLNGTFDDAYQAALNEAFEALLPETPPWGA